MWGAQMKKVFVLLILSLVFSCELAYNNAVDPDSDSYQGFPVVQTIDEIEAIQSETTTSYFYPQLRASEVLGARQYEFQISQTGADFDTELEMSVLSETPVIDLYDHGVLPGAWSYQWRVRAHDEAGPGPWAESPHGFSIAVLQGDQVSPPNGGTHEPANDVWFQWTELPGADHFEIQHATTLEGLETAQEYTISSENYFHGFSLVDGEVRFWRIRAVRVDGRKGFWSEAFMMTGQSPDVITLNLLDSSNPAMNAAVQDVTPTIRWDVDTSNFEGKEVDLFSIRYTTNSIGNLPNVNIYGTTPSEYTIPLNELSYGDTVLWQVMCYFKDGTHSSWSSIHSFSVEWNVDWANLEIFPLDSAQETPHIIDRLTWAPVPGANRYIVSLDDGNTYRELSGYDYDGQNYFALIDDENTPSSVERTITGRSYTWTITPYDDDNVICPAIGSYQFIQRAPMVSDRINGGVVVHVENSPANRVLIAAENNAGSGNRWGPDEFIASPGNEALFDGAQNTTELITAFGTDQNSAAFIARNWNGGGYTDWFLPNIAELGTISMNFGRIADIEGLLNISQYEKFWTSSQDTEWQAITLDFYDLIVEPNPPTLENKTASELKNRNYQVRPMRYQEF